MLYSLVNTSKLHLPLFFWLARVVACPGACAFGSSAQAALDQEGDTDEDDLGDDTRPHHRPAVKALDRDAVDVRPKRLEERGGVDAERVGRNDDRGERGAVRLQHVLGGERAQ